MNFDTLLSSIKDASAKTGLPYGFIRQLCLDNKIKYIRSGVKFYVRMDSLIEYCGGMENGTSKLNTNSMNLVVDK